MSAREEIGDEAQVAFTVRELFEKLDGKLDKIDGKLDSKVDRAEFVEYVSKSERRFETYGHRIGALEDTEQQRRGVTAWSARAWALLGAGAAVLAALAAVIGVVLGGGHP